MTDLINTNLAQSIINTASQKNLKITTAESCTGGLIGGTLTAVSGSSSVYDGGFITYANEAKRDMLAVPWDLLMEKGAVSAEVAEAMALGALRQTSPRCQLAVSVTGVAGPGGGTAEKPVGLVYFGLATDFDQGNTLVKNQKIIFREVRRDSIRQRTVETALKMLQQAIDRVPDK
ncbi:MAG: CinA family protein [Aquisalinus sp.]|nr:CinA family protein [Aquisalinus sp.]